MHARSASSNRLLTLLAGIVVLAVVGYVIINRTAGGAATQPGGEPTAPRATSAPVLAATIDLALDEAEPTLDLALVETAPATDTPAARAPKPTRTPRPKASATASAPVASDLIVRDQRILALDGSVAYEGDIDLAPVLKRIMAGKRDRHPNDGASFGNREGLLPRKPRNYYTEWVIRTPGLREVGPQRLITGREGEVYYTPDHYQTFVRIR